MQLWPSSLPFLALLFAFTTSADALAQGLVDPDTVRLNHIQVLGSHNSYRKPIHRNIMFALRHLDLFYGRKRSSPADQLFYSHLPFDQQFSRYGIRCLEIDIHYDPQGSLYYRRRGNLLFHVRPNSRIEALKAPGMKVLHIADIDYNTHYYTFKESLVAVRDWLLVNPNSLPIYILVEPKDESVGNRVGLGFTKVLPFDKTALEAVDVEIAEVFAGNESMVYRPDDMRGTHPTLHDRMASDGWPRLAQVRGKVIFIINGGTRETEAYADGHPSFADRWMFSFSKPGQPETVFVKRDNPNAADIPELIRQGYIVRTRTDTPGDEARLNDNTRKETAFRSGAQMLCTDYYRPDQRLSDYEVHLPFNQPAMLNFLSKDAGRPVFWEPFY